MDVFHNLNISVSNILNFLGCQIWTNVSGKHWKCYIGFRGKKCIKIFEKLALVYSINKCFLEGVIISHYCDNFCPNFLEPDLYLMVQVPFTYGHRNTLFSFSPPVVLHEDVMGHCLQAQQFSISENGLLAEEKLSALL